MPPGLIAQKSDELLNDSQTLWWEVVEQSYDAGLYNVCWSLGIHSAPPRYIIPQLQLEGAGHARQNSDR
jgi:hypothetical protein